MKAIAIPAAVLFAMLAAAITWIVLPSDLDRVRAAVEQGDHQKALGLLVPLAEAGDPEAQFQLGRIFASGRSFTFDNLRASGRAVPKTAGEALKWFGAAARQDHPKALLELGDRAAQTAGGGEDLPRAIEFYHRAALAGESGGVEALRELAARGEARAGYRLGRMFALGEGVPKAEHVAVEWFRKAAAGGEARAEAELRKRAREGVPEAAYHLGRMYTLGEGLPVDLPKAAHWYEQAATLGHAQAQSRLGEMLEVGRGVRPDAAAAARWHQMAAQQGNSRSQYLLAIMYKQSRGVQGSEAKAVSWLRKAIAGGNRAALPHILGFARAGNANAQFEAGSLFYAGQVWAEDNLKAISWWRKAARQGHAEAQFHLAYMFAQGQGTPTDMTEAVDWYGRAATGGHAPALAKIQELAEAGNGAAQFYFGRHLAAGGAAPTKAKNPASLDLTDRVIRLFRSAQKDSRTQGLEWLRLAAQGGHAGARKYLEQKAGAAATPEQGRP